MTKKIKSFVMVLTFLIVLLSFGNGIDTVYATKHYSNYCPPFVCCGETFYVFTQAGADKNFEIKNVTISDNEHLKIISKSKYEIKFKTKKTGSVYITLTLKSNTKKKYKLAILPKSFSWDNKIKVKLSKEKKSDGITYNKISWDEVKGATGYIILRETSNGNQVITRVKNKTSVYVKSKSKCYHVIPYVKVGGVEYSTISGKTK